ncbi:bifunctional DNA primase/polymerase [Bacteroidota bacterium]
MIHDEMNKHLQYYREQGLSIIPIPEGRKEATITWKEYQIRLATDGEIERWFGNNQTNLAIICGKISGNLVILDFDDEQGFNNWVDIAKAKLGFDNIHAFTPIVQTGRGFHVYFRTKELVKSQKFPNVEIKGEGGYVIAPPSIHPGGTQYKLINPDIKGIITIESLISIGIDTETTPERRHEPTWVSKALEGVSEGNRNNTAMMLAGYFKNKHPQDITETLLLDWNKKNVPPLPENELLRTISSAYTYPPKTQDNVENNNDIVNRGGVGDYSLPCPAEAKIGTNGDQTGQGVSSHRNLSLEIRDWVVETGGRWFTRVDMDKEVDIFTPQDKENRKKIIQRLKHAGEIEEHPFVSGKYRFVDANCEDIAIGEAFVGEPIPFQWPFGIESYANLYPGNLVVIAGSPNAGKTAMLLNLVAMNQNEFEIYYFSSEMAEQEFNLRLSLFKDVEKWNFHPKMKSSNFADVIKPDAINIVDYLEMTDDFYKVSGYLAGITNKLKNGIAIVALQMKRGATLGRGGEFSLEKARLYLTMDSGKIRIEKAKNWHKPDFNPNGMSSQFKLVNGCDFSIIRPLSHIEE